MDNKRKSRLSLLMAVLMIIQIVVQAILSIGVVAANSEEKMVTIKSTESFPRDERVFDMTVRANPYKELSIQDQ